MNKLTAKDKQLLLVDLCARLPYGVKLLVEGWDSESMIEVDAYRRGIEDALKYCLTTIQIYERDKNSKTT